MKVGDKVRLTPTFDNRAGLEHVVNIPATIVYIHPQMRVFVAEFTAPLGSWRGAFPCILAERGRQA